MSMGKDCQNLKILLYCKWISSSFKGEAAVGEAAVDGEVIVEKETMAGEQLYFYSSTALFSF